MNHLFRPMLTAVQRLWGREPILLGALLIIVLGGWGFLALTSEVLEGDTEALDQRIVLWLRQPGDPARPRGPAWMHETARDVTALGGYPVLVLVTASIVGFLAMDRKWAAVCFVLGAVIGGTVLSMLLKELIGRERPNEELWLVPVGSASFPSGHSMMSAVVYLTLGVLLASLVPALRLKMYLIGVALVASVLVGLSRIYLGVHYPTDVLGGWAAGLVWATLCWLLVRWLQHLGQVEKEL